MKLWRHRGARAALLILGLMGLLALLAPWLPLADPGAGELSDQLHAPRGSHWFGTDTLGRDLFARTLSGIRSSLFIGLLGALVSLVIGVLVGALAGFSGRLVDGLLMRLVDVLYGIPFICLVIFLLAVLRDHEPVLRAHGITRETVLYTVVGATTWLTMARLVRNEVVRLRGQPFVEAARAQGLTGSRILIRHLLPNALGVIVVALTMTIPSVLLYEAFLSFLGLGIEPPGVSLGLLAAEGVEALGPLHLSWWLIVFPGGALALLLLSFSLLGDGLRDVLDPRDGRFLE
jgi:oligopeptide transport system permease protein